MPIVSIDNENDEQNSADKPYNASDMRRVPVAAGAAAPEKVVIKRPMSAQVRASYKRMARRRRISTTIRYIILIIVGLIMIYPLIWMVGATFKDNSEIFKTMNPIPVKTTLNGYKNAVKSYGGSINIWKAMLNTYSYVIPDSHIHL